MINEIALAVLALLAGAALAALHLVMLWWQVRRLGEQLYPALTMLAGLLLRLFVLTGSFYLILVNLGLLPLVIALLGFTLFRIVLLNTALSKKISRATQGK